MSRAAWSVVFAGAGFACLAVAAVLVLLRAPEGAVVAFAFAAPPLVIVGLALAKGTALDRPLPPEEDQW